MRGIFLNNKGHNVTWLSFFCNMTKKRTRACREKIFADFFGTLSSCAHFSYARCTEASCMGFTSDALLYVPHEGAETKHLVIFINLLEAVKERLRLPILHNCDDRAVH